MQLSWYSFQFTFIIGVLEVGQRAERAQESYWPVAESSPTISASIYSAAALPAIVCQENLRPPRLSLEITHQHTDQHTHTHH